MRRAIVASIIAPILAPAISACSTPTPQILLGYSDAASQTCPSTECKDVPLPCDAVMSIRIVDPDDPIHAYLEQCTSVPANLGYDACSLNGVDLESMPIPVRDVEVEVAVFPRSALPVDEHGDPVCPKDTQYSAASGFPVEQSPAPALGGSAFYHPGDEVVSVTLGCTNLSPAQAGAACITGAATPITATVDDFDTRLPVGVDVARALYVSVGEPRALSGRSVLGPLDTVPLRLDGGDPPVWSAAVSREFTQNACVQVLEDVAATTATLRCVPVTPEPGAALTGARLARRTLNEILQALSLSELPDDGLTIGMVVDAAMKPAAGYAVMSTTGTVQYLTDTGGLTTDGMTSTTGIFLSRDAPFGTLFSVKSGRTTVAAVGGLVAGKVTIAIVPLPDPAP